MSNNKGPEPLTETPKGFFNKGVSRFTAYSLMVVLVTVLIGAGFYIGNRWFWPNKENYYEKQIDDLQEMMMQIPKTTSARAQVAMEHYLDGNPQKAVNLLREVLKEEPGNPTATLYLGLILSEQKQYPEAIDLLTGYTARNPGSGARIAYLYLGRDYTAIGNYEPALRCLTEAAKRDKGNPLVHFSLGQVYEKLNDRKNAIASYQKALEIAKDYAEAKIALNNLLKK